MKAKYNITGYVDEKNSSYILQTVYRETPKATPKIEYTSYLTLRKLNKEMLKAIEHAKRNNYDYRIELKRINLVEPDTFDYRTN